MTRTVKVPAQRVSGKPVTHEARAIAPGLLDALITHIGDRYSGLSDHDALIIALWIIHTYFYQDLGKCAYLHIASLSINAGKSTLGDIITDLSYEADNLYPSATAIAEFRESGKHTLIIDQFDSIIASRNTDLGFLYGIINNGYTERGARQKVSGKDARSLFCPKVFIGIGPDILEKAADSRSIRIIVSPGNEADQRERNRRQTLRPVSESVPALRARLTRIRTAAICKRVTADMLPSCDRTQLLNDGSLIINRTQDIWRVLIVMADLFGSECGKRMRDIVAGRNSAEPEYLPTAADMIDARLRALMREGKLTATNWLPSSNGKIQAPLLGQTGYPMTDADFGYPAPRNGQRGRLPEITLWRKPDLRCAQLRIRTGKARSDFNEICTALGMPPASVKHAYQDAGRLEMPNGRSSAQRPFRQGQGDVTIIMIDVSCWLWPVTETETAEAN
jgi:hypothetical protein